ncbi:MAG TPA: alpha/beta hydrolase [Steroidobacteraceae bacterium]
MQRRDFLGAAAGGLTASLASSRSARAIAAENAASPDRAPGATFLVAHGAWSAGWAWKKMHPLMSAAGDRLITPTYTGLGERVHLANRSNDLETHILDLLGVIQYEDLHDLVLIGHSYGGMVATGVADRARDRIAKLVYLDAFVPKDGQAQADLIPDGHRTMEARAKAGDGWRVPPNPSPSDTSEADLRWIAERRLPQSLKCFVQPLTLRHGEATLPHTYIYCKRIPPGDPFSQFADRARQEHWAYYEMDASHSPHITAPDALAAVLRSVAAAPKI